MAELAKFVLSPPRPKRHSSLPGEVLLLDDGYCSRDKFDAAVAFVVSRMQPAMSLQIVPPIEIILPAKLAGEVVLSFTMLPMFCQI